MIDPFSRYFTVLQHIVFLTIIILILFNFSHLGVNNACDMINGMEEVLTTPPRLLWDIFGTVLKTAGAKRCFQNFVFGLKIFFL